MVQVNISPAAKSQQTHGTSPLYILYLITLLYITNLSLYLFIVPFVCRSFLSVSLNFIQIRCPNQDQPCELGNPLISLTLHIERNW